MRETYSVLNEGEVVFRGSYEKCVEYAKDNWLMRYVNGVWTMNIDSAII